MQVAKFIFGDNKAVDKEGKESISMTAPVRMTVPQEDKSENIAMTAPVRTQQVTGTASMSDPLLGTATYKVSFTMPSKYTMVREPLLRHSSATVERMLQDRLPCLLLTC